MLIALLLRTTGCVVKVELNGKAYVDVVVLVAWPDAGFCAFVAGCFILCVRCVCWLGINWFFCGCLSSVKSIHDFWVSLKTENLMRGQFYFANCTTIFNLKKLIKNTQLILNSNLLFQLFKWPYLPSLPHEQTPKSLSVGFVTAYPPLVCSANDRVTFTEKVGFIDSE